MVLRRFGWAEANSPAGSGARQYAVATAACECGTRSSRRQRPPLPAWAATGAIHQDSAPSGFRNTLPVAFATGGRLCGHRNAPPPGVQAPILWRTSRPTNSLGPGCWPFSTLTPHGSSGEITSTMSATIREWAGGMRNHVAAHMFTLDVWTANHYASKVRREPVRSASGGERGWPSLHCLHDEVGHRPLSMTVRSDITAVHGEPRTLLRLGESGSMSSAVSVASSPGWVDSDIKPACANSASAERLSAWAIDFSTGRGPPARSE
jgi:hypothetical protein